MKTATAAHEKRPLPQTKNLLPTQAAGLLGLAPIPAGASIKTW